MFVDKGGEGRGVGVQNLDFFADVINVWPVIKLFFAIEYDFFLCLFTLCSSIFSFIALHDKQKRYNHTLKRQGRINLQTNLKMHYTIIFLLYHFPVCFFIFSFIALNYKQKRYNHNLKKRQGRINLQINIKMHYTQVRFKGQDKLSMTRISCRAC